MDIIKEYRMHKNTQHIDITTLTNSVDELNKNIVKLIKLLEKDKKSKKR